jgi:hypothetical protein
MRAGKMLRLAGAAATAVALIGATAPTTAVASGNRTITVHMTAKGITFSTGSSTSPGFVVFEVKGKDGAHALQLLKLRGDYTFKQASRDSDKAFSGDTDAIRRIDHKILWLGGAEAGRDHPGRFAETLYPGTYIALDQNGNAKAKLHVTSSTGPTGTIPASSVITAKLDKSGDSAFATSRKTLPHKGWTLFRNKADQPHFLVLQQVAKGTTRHQVTKYFNSGGQGQPSWIRSGSDDTGVIAPGTQIYWHYRVPRGRYLIICFWPDVKTGMPHGLMGMFKLRNFT